jgi:transcriptional regulator with XRE-family HTH domain
MNFLDGKSCREIRTHAKLSQLQLAKLAGVSQGAICVFEQKNAGGVEAKKKIMAALDTLTDPSKSKGLFTMRELVRPPTEQRLSTIEEQTRQIQASLETNLRSLIQLRLKGMSFEQLVQVNNAMISIKRGD